MKNSKGSLMRPFPAPESASRPVTTPLFPTAVYASDTPDMLDAQYAGELHGYTYSREGHPNADVLARMIDRLEGVPEGITGTLAGSGMGSVTNVLMGLLAAGDHLIGGSQLYGQTLQMMKRDLPRLGIETSLTDTTSAEAVAEAIRPNTKMILIEVVSNPTLALADVAGIAELCKAKGILLAVDNTFTTPHGFKPFDHGADIVIHSVTKLLAGHADVLLGYCVAKDPELNARLKQFNVCTGMTASPFDCWQAERGMLTFDLRFERAQATAVRLADMLADLPGVKKTIYPLHTSHPQYQRAQALLNGQGGNMVSFELDGGRAAANAFARAAEAISFAPTLGDVATTLSHPASSSHRCISIPEREAQGVSEGFYRVSVGLEDPEALLAVFAQAVEAARGA